MKRWLKRHRTEMIVSIILTGLVASSRDVLSSHFIQSARTQLYSVQQRGERERLQLEKTQAEFLAKVADTRYQNGCHFVHAIDNPSKLVSIAAGDKLFDLTKGKKGFVGEGTVVCAHNGTTAIARRNANGEIVATDVAFTGNSEVISKALQRRGIQLNKGRENLDSSAPQTGAE